MKTFAPYASYFAINVSSPNTPGLRDLQQRAAFDELAARVAEAREQAAARRPLLVKIAPDLDLRGLDDVVEVCARRGVDGLIVANTTIARPASIQGRDHGEAGGLSGRPLFESSTRMLARAYLRCGGALTLIGSGGVENAETALAKIEAGATLAQVYTGLVYRGPALIGEILQGLALAVERAARSPRSPDRARANGRRARAEAQGARRAPSNLSTNHTGSTTSAPVASTRPISRKSVRPYSIRRCTRLTKLSMMLAGSKPKVTSTMPTMNDTTISRSATIAGEPPRNAERLFMTSLPDRSRPLA